MRTVTIGTVPILLYDANKTRTRWTIQFIPSSIITGNTGKIYVGRGFVPTATDGDANSGEILNAGSSIEEKKQWDADVLPWKGQIWVVASIAGQICEADQQTSVDVNSPN